MPGKARKDQIFKAFYKALIKLDNAQVEFFQNEKRIMMENFTRIYLKLVRAIGEGGLQPCVNRFHLYEMIFDALDDD